MRRNVQGMKLFSAHLVFMSFVLKLPVSLVPD